MVRLVSILLFTLCLVFFPVTASLSVEKSQSVVVTGTGETLEKALEKAFSEAITDVAGIVLAERSTVVGEKIKEQLIGYSRGTVKNYEILEKKNLENGYSVTIRAFVDSNAIAERTKDFIQGFQAEVSESKGNSHIDNLINLLVDQMSSYSYDDFVSTKIMSVKKDEKDHTLNISLRFVFNRKLYLESFFNGVSLLVDRIVKDPEFISLLSPEKEKDNRNTLVDFHLLAGNGLSKSFVLPIDMADPIVSSLGFSSKSIPIGASFSRAWLHISLFNKKGDEIERIPVEIPLTNVVVFLIRRKTESTVERITSNLLDTSDGVPMARSPYEIVIAPSFGVAIRNGDANFFTDSEQSIFFELPEPLFSNTVKIRANLNFEKW